MDMILAITNAMIYTVHYIIIAVVNPFHKASVPQRNISSYCSIMI